MAEVFTFLSNCKASKKDVYILLLAKLHYYCVVKLIWLLTLTDLSITKHTQDLKRSNNKTKQKKNVENRSKKFNLLFWREFG